MHSVNSEFCVEAQELRTHLLEDIMPFWMRHTIDRKNGGIFSCINDRGEIQSRDKYLWSQTRALWTFSALCRRVENRDEWAEIAHQLFGFLRRHGCDEQGRWIFRTDEHGNPLEGATSIYTDSFAILGLAEYFALCGNEEALDLALATCDSVIKRLAVPGSYETAPYPTPSGMKAHGEAMQFSYAFVELGRGSGREELISEGRRIGRDLLHTFWQPERNSFLEYITLDNQFRDTPEGRAMVPGHGIESAYFQILNFQDTLEDDLKLRACDAIRCCLERGWDPDFGGLFLGIDAMGKEPVYWKNHTMKLWWPHTEALPACLLAWEICREDWCLEWFEKIKSWAFEKFPRPEFGEWTQRLDREGYPIERLVALPVKDPFHLPRSLIFALEVLDRHPNQKFQTQ